MKMDDLETLHRKVDELVSCEEIRAVLYQFTRHMDRRNAEGVKAGYHPDARDIHWGTFIGNAHDFADYMVGELVVVKNLIHEITNPIIEFDADNRERAFVESRYTSRARIDFEGAQDGEWIESVSHGRYLDIFERREGAWKIAHRRLAQDAGRVSIVTDVAQYNPDAVSKELDDPVYKKFDILAIAPGVMTAGKGRFEKLREWGKLQASRA